MKAAIYCRVSTEDQEREGTSLQSQLEACKRLAQERDYEVPEEFIAIETYSGLSLERPKLNELREWVRTKEIDAVIAFTLDRLSRDPVHFIILQEELEKAGVEVILVTEDVDSSDMGRLITYIKGFAAKLEAEKIKERTIRGKIARAKGGRLLGGTGSKLYGYNYLPGKGVGEGVRYVKEDQARWVREIFCWLVEEGLTVNGIIYRLRGLGVPTPSGKGHWGKATVHKILTNQAYIGRTYAFTQTRVEAKKHNKATRKNKATHIIFKPPEEWIEIPNATPPIISEELFQQTKARLQKNRELASRNGKRKYLLSGYVFCRHCGRRYCGGPVTVSKNKCERYYRCPKRLKIVSPIPCRNRQWRADSLEGLVWGEIEQVLSKPEVILAGLETKENEESKVNSYQRELEAIETNLRHMEKEKDRAWKAFEITGDEPKFRGEIEGIIAGIEGLERQRQGIERRIELVAQSEINIDGIKKFCELARSNLDEFTFEDKRLALEALQIKVWVDGEHITLEGAIPVAESDIVSTTLWHNR